MCSAPRRRRLRRRLTQNGRTLVLAVRTFHALRRTPSPPWRSPRGLSRCAHFQSTTIPAFSHYEAPGGLHMCSLPTQDEPCHRRQGNTSEGRPCLGCGKPSAGPPVRGPWWQPCGAPACGGALRCLPSALRSREPLRVLRGATLIRVCAPKHPPVRGADRRIAGVLSEVHADAVGPREALESGDEGALRLLDDGRHGAGMGTKRAAARTRGLEPALQRYQSFAHFSLSDPPCSGGRPGQRRERP